MPIIMCGRLNTLLPASFVRQSGGLRIFPRCSQWWWWCPNEDVFVSSFHLSIYLPVFRPLHFFVCISFSLDDFFASLMICAIPQPLAGPRSLGAPMAPSFSKTSLKMSVSALPVVRWIHISHFIIFYLSHNPSNGCIFLPLHAWIGCCRWWGTKQEGEGSGR